MAAAGLRTWFSHRSLSRTTTIVGRRHNDDIVRGGASLSVLRQPACAPRRVPGTSTPGRVPDFAFAFDIDGVLLRSSSPIPGAADALKYLQRSSIPFILLTNGGGLSEAARTEGIAKKLSVSLDESLIVQSHTPFAELARSTPMPTSTATITAIEQEEKEEVTSDFYKRPSLKDKTILVVGGSYDKCQQVATSYGFSSVVTPADIYAAHPEIWPFSGVFKEYYSKFARPPPRPINSVSPQDSLKIDAIFVFNDPRDWGLDIQLILDLLLSQEGILGTYSRKNGDKSLPNNGYQQDGQPPLYFSNPDLVWAASYPLNRLGQGGFREALQGVWNAVTHSARLDYTLIGKPYQETYEYAERKLLRHRQKLFGDVAVREQRLKTVYMVGDNPESDIAGANSCRSAHGIDWKSLLTLTGVYHPRHGQRPAHEPTAIVDNVKEAVRWALRDRRWHEDLD